MRAAAEAEARDRALINDSFVFLAMPQPQVGRFLQRRIREQERQTGVREDDFIPIVGVMPERSLHERLIELGLGPAVPVFRSVWAQFMSDRNLPQVIEER